MNGPKRPHRGGGNRPPNRPNRPRGARGPASSSAGGNPPAASVSANFEVADFRKFLHDLGMPATLVKQLDEWLHGLDVADEPEEMQPELMWDGRPTRMSIVGAVDEHGLAYVEFRGPESLIAEVQGEMDRFFGSGGAPKKK